MNPGFIIMIHKTKGNRWNIVMQIFHMTRCIPSVKISHAHILWDGRGVIYTEFLTTRATVYSQRYCDTLWSLKNASAQSGLKRKNKKILLHHSTAQPHCCAQERETVTRLKFTIVSHPPYIPDLASSDFWLFPEQKETLKGQNFSSDAKSWSCHSHINYKPTRNFQRS